MGAGSGRIWTKEHREKLEKLRCIHQALPAIGFRHGPPLLLVAIENDRIGHALDDGRKLPGKVLSVAHARIQAQPTRRGKAVGRIPKQKHPTLAVSLRHLGRHGPWADVFNRKRDRRFA